MKDKPPIAPGSGQPWLVDVVSISRMPMPVDLGLRLMPLSSSEARQVAGQMRRQLANAAVCLPEKSHPLKSQKKEGN